MFSSGWIYIFGAQCNGKAVDRESTHTFSVPDKNNLLVLWISSWHETKLQDLLISEHLLCARQTAFMNEF